MKKNNYSEFRPMKVQVKAGSASEKYYRQQAGLPGGVLARPRALAPGIAASPLHDLIFHGGKTVPQMQFQNLFVGGAAAWVENDITLIDRAIATAMSDVRLDNVMRQYFPGQSISCTALASRVLPGTRPPRVSEGDVELVIRQQHAAGALDGNDLATTVFNLVLPSGAVLTDAAAPTGNFAATARKPAAAAPVRRELSSLNGLGGYHGSVHVTSKITVYYSVNVFSETLPNGRENGIAVFDQPWKSVVGTLYHELNEFRTDPDVGDAIAAGNDPAGVDFLGWTSRQGEEVGDFPIFAAGSNLERVFKEVKATGKTFFLPIQFQYSNAVHGPEGPIKKPHS